MCVCVLRLSRVQLFATPWTVAHQAPLSLGILQARILEWVAMPSSRGSSQPRDGIQVSCIAGRFFTNEPAGNPEENLIDNVFFSPLPPPMAPPPLPQLSHPSNPPSLGLSNGRELLLSVGTELLGELSLVQHKPD